jgi:hypothetical protein
MNVYRNDFWTLNWGLSIDGSYEETVHLIKSKIKCKAIPITGLGDL